MDGTLIGLSHDEGENLWVSDLEFPMIGSLELHKPSQMEEIFIPLLDGSIIKYDKEGFFEVSIYLVIIY